MREIPSEIALELIKLLKTGGEDKVKKTPDYEPESKDSESSELPKSIQELIKFAKESSEHKSEQKIPEQETPKQETSEQEKSEIPSTLEQLLKMAQEEKRKREEKKQNPYFNEYICQIKGNVLYMGKVTKVSKEGRQITYYVDGYVQCIKSDNGNYINSLVLLNEGSFFHIPDGGLKIISEDEYVNRLALLSAAFVSKVTK